MAMIRSILAVLLLAAPVAAQQAPVTIVATLNGESAKPLPIIGRFWFVAAGGRDSVAALTDGTGRAQLTVALGSYQVRSHQRVTLAGRAWYWDSAFPGRRRSPLRRRNRQGARHHGRCDTRRRAVDEPVPM